MRKEKGRQNRYNLQPSSGTRSLDDLQSFYGIRVHSWFLWHTLRHWHAFCSPCSVKRQRRSLRNLPYNDHRCTQTENPWHAHSRAHIRRVTISMDQSTQCRSINKIVFRTDRRSLFLYDILFYKFLFDLKRNYAVFIILIVQFLLIVSYNVKANKL